MPNNLPCASVTDSALCLFDVATKGICVVSDEDSTPTTDPTTACDTVQQDCPTDVFADAFCLEEQQFRLLFTPDGPNWPSYKLNASNPGQYFYNWISESPGCEPGVTMETFTVSIPFPFVTQGRNSVHIYDGFEVGNADGVDCFMPPEEAEEAFPLSITMEDWINGAGDGVENLELFCPGIGQSMLPLASGESEEFCTFEVTATYPSDSCQIYLNVHLDYGLKGKDVDGNPADTFPDRYLPMPLAVLSDYGSQDAYMRVPADGSLGGIALADCTVYPFSHVDGGGPFGDNVESLNYFKGAKGAVVGLVQSSSNGQGKSQAGVSITHPTKGPAASGDTDDDGFFWINYKHKGKPTYYTITIELDDGSEVSGEVLLKGNGFAEAYFDVDTGTVIVQDASSTGGNGKGNNK